MAINESELSKGELRKLTALRKSLGDDIADKAMAEWIRTKPTAVSLVDPVAVKIEEALASFANDKKFKLGIYGYRIVRNKGKGAAGFVATKIGKPE